VLGPAIVPAVIDPAVAEQQVELSVLSAVAHGNGPNGLSVVEAALIALGRLDREHAAVYFQVIWNALRDPMQKGLEALVMARKTEGEGTLLPSQPWLIDVGKRAEAAAARARAVLTVLHARGVAMRDDARERILAEKDPTRLERWLEKAAVAASIADVLDNPS
jgi:hypothetical protein